jgi:hypothetical protein
MVLVSRKPRPAETAMTDLFEMLNTITRRRKTVAGSPFVSVKSTEKWLKSLPSESDYDTHHTLVQGLERFNAENEAATISRMKSLMKLEAAGLPMQLRVVEQYVRNQAAFRLARQALWRESWMFWSLLAEAWLGMLKQAYRGPASAELKPFVADIATRALRYSGLVMRWDYHQARNPAESAWRRVHKIYRLVERDGYAMQEVLINARPTHCAREYALVVLMGLVHPLGYRAQEIEAIAQILDGYEPLPLPTQVPRPGEHTHIVDLSLSEGASVLNGACVQGRRLRYFALRPMIDYLKSMDQTPETEVDKGFPRQIASLIERGGIGRNRQRTHRFGHVWVAGGMDNILKALADPDTARTRAAMDSWALRDESLEGMGFALSESQAQALQHGRLVMVSWDPSENVWQLQAIRWTHEVGGQHLVGTQTLSRHPKRVEIQFEEADSGARQEKTWAVFLPMSHLGQSVSNLLIPQAHYRMGAPLTLLDGDVVYRLRLGEVHESHEGWLRVGMDVVGREQFAAAA